LTPTREIALQSKEVMNTVGKEMISQGDLNCGIFIGGIPLEENLKSLLQQPNIIIGTPGT
jgi:superfamily II DNA/RNA helicase